MDEHMLTCSWCGLDFEQDMAKATEHCKFDHVSPVAILKWDIVQVIETKEITEQI